MKKYQFTLMTLAIFIIILLSGRTRVSAAPPANTEHKNFTLGNDVTFKGVFSSHSLYFNIEKYSQVKSIQANIYFNISQLVDETKHASITFSINGEPFFSSYISYNESQQMQYLKASIPLKSIKSGINEFRIASYCRISYKPCIDDVNMGNWLNLYGNSNLSMKFVNRQSSNNISEFPYPFIKNSSNNDYTTVIAVPDNYTEQELSAALLLETYFGKQNSTENYNGTIVKYSSIPKNKNIIYIGSAKKLPEEIKSIFPRSEIQNYSNYSVIKKVSSPFNKNNKLMTIISENGDMLKKAARLLANKSIVDQLDTDTFKVDSSIKVEQDSAEPISKLTLKDLELNEIILKGPFRQSSSIQYSLPKNRLPSSGCKIKLIMRYSQNVDFNRSLVTVYVNGTPIGSKKLSSARCNDDHLELSVPNDVKRSNSLNIEIAFDLEIPDSFCQLRQEEMPWAIVTNDSYIYIPNNENKFYSFDTYPQPFVSNNKFNDTALVVPENLSENEVEALSRLFLYMGKDIDYNTGNIEVVTDKNFSGKYHGMNLIVYGTPGNNQVIKNMNSNLWFKFNKNYTSFSGNEKLYLTEPYASNAAAFQFDISPYDSRKSVLILTSPKKDLLLKSLVFLSSSKQFLKLSGDSILIDSFGNIKTFQFKKENTESLYNKFSSIDTSTRTFMGFAALILIFSIAAIVLYKLKNRKFK